MVRNKTCKKRYERLSSLLSLTDSLKAVDESVATLGTRAEKCMARAKAHFEMCHFSTEDDQLKVLVERLSDRPKNKIFGPYHAEYLRLLRALMPSRVEGDQLQNFAMTKRSFKWIMDHMIYQSWWKSETPAILHLSGAKGSGKTVISHFLVNALTDSEGSDEIAVASFFFDKDDERCNKAHTLFLSLAGQLLIARPTLFSYVSDLYSKLDKSSGPGQKLNIDQTQAWNLLRTILSCPGGRGVICIINAIHECRSEIKPFLTDLAALKDTAEAQFKVYISSTTQAEEFAGQLKSCHEISLNDEENMQSQVRESIENSVSKLVQDKPALLSFKEEIQTQTCDSSHLNLLQANLNLKYLEAVSVQSTPSSVRSMLESLSQTTPEMAFRLAIDNTDRSIRQWTLKVLSWLSYSFRPLHLGELATALAIQDWESSADPSDDHLARDIAADLTRFLGAIIRIQNNEVRFTHPSIRDAVRAHVENENTRPEYKDAVRAHVENENTRPEYKDAVRAHVENENARLEYKPISHRSIARTCLSYLSIARLKGTLEILENGTYEAETSLSTSKQYSKEHGLVLYAVQYWPAHYRLVTDPSAEDTCRVSELLENNEWMQVWSKIDLNTQRPVLDLLDSEVSPVHLAADLGFEDVVNLKVKDLQGLAAGLGGKADILKVAAGKDRLPIIKYLLQNIHYDSKEISVALLEALGKDSKSVVPELKRALYEKKEDPGTGLLLERASLAGDLDLVQWILQLGDHQKIPQFEILRALRAAAAVGNGIIVQLLLVSKWLTRGEVRPVEVEGPSSALHDAVSNGHQRVVDILISNQEPINTKDERSRTPLHLASIMGYPHIVKLLIQNGIGDGTKTEVDAQDSVHRTPLHYAAFYGYDDVVKVLLTTNLKLDEKDAQGETALHLAAREQRSTVIDKLLTAGAAIDLKNKYHETALHIAVAAESMDVVVKLVKAETAALDLDKKDSKGFTPLMLAARLGLAAIFEFIADKGADISSTDLEGSTALHWAARGRHLAMAKVLVSLKADLEATDASDLRPIHHAAKNGDVAMLKVLLDAKADIESKTPRDKTALHIAAESGNRDSVEFLLSRDANADQRDWISETPLDNATDARNFEIVGLLLKSAFDKDSVDLQRLGRLLHIAALRPQPEIVRLLLEKGVDASSEDEVGDSALANAMFGQSVEVAELLIAAGADVNGAMSSGRTAFQVAAGCGQIDAIQLFLGHGADINRSYGRPGTPLHVAAANDNLVVVRFLLENGANVNGRGGYYETALQSAVSNGQQEAAELLISKGADLHAGGGKWGNPLNAAVVTDSSLAPTLIDCLFKHGASLQDSDEQGRAAIHMAANIGNLDLMKHFLEEDCDGLTRKDKQGRTVLHHAACRGHNNVVSYVLAAQDTTEQAAFQEPDSDRWTALHWACRGANENVVRLLLEHGADPSVVSTNGWTANHVAIFHGQRDIISRSQRVVSHQSSQSITLSKSKSEKERKGREEEEENKGEGVAEKADEDAEDEHKDDESDEDNSDEEEGGEDAKPLFDNGLPLRSGRKGNYTCDSCYCVSTSNITKSEAKLTGTGHIRPSISLHSLREYRLLLQVLLGDRGRPPGSQVGGAI